ncbi:homeobox protein NANOG-like [Varanus komodoensis]|uniref:homeobox protein NANOG-like n=1 Tax=Varanus komodoensis TaxID=61221 RepID=UPI001CF7E41D|nr:homeobox protein NANOG-like [Varanus komodoensis]
MNAPLTINASYLVYPAGAATGAGMGYDEYCWHSLEEMEPLHCSKGFLAQEALSGQEEKALRNNPDLSPRSSSSGVFTLYTPDSATSPNRQLSSPQPSSTPQRRKEESAGGRKVKTRTAFSQEQLQILHHRFQSQKYLSPQQIRELASALELTYKQIKTWFQNQRMKLKRTQKETLWMRKGMCPSQNSYLNINPSYHQGYGISDGRNVHSLASVHENYAGNQSYGSDHQIYGSPQNFCPIVSGEDGSFFGKAAGTCYSQQAISYISQQKMNFYHGFSASVEYATVKMEDGYPFPNVSPSAAALPGTSALQHYQAPLPIQGGQNTASP